MPCDARNYDKVTDAVFQCLAAKAAEFGIKISADSGTAKKSGFKISWNYDRAAKTLTLQCLDKPPVLFKCKDVNEKMDEVVNGCRSG